MQNLTELLLRSTSALARWLEKIGAVMVSR